MKFSKFFLLALLAFPLAGFGQQTKVNFADVANVIQIKKACKEGDGFACFALGRAHQLGKGAEFSKKLAHESFVRSCELGNFDGCFEVGEQYSDGEYVKKDEEKKEFYYHKACDLGSMNACYYFGLLLAYDNGRETESLELLKKGCELGHPLSCQAYKNSLPQPKKKSSKK